MACDSPKATRPQTLVTPPSSSSLPPLRTTTSKSSLPAKRRIPVIHRSDLLADLIRLKPNAVVVGGTHGKTTTTSMISAILDRANIGATSIIGGILHRSGTNARWGTGDYIVAEADEHDGSFLRLNPTIGVVTNIDAEHLEYYGTLDHIKRAFTDFCNTIPFYGYSIICHDDDNARSIIPNLEAVCVTYGLTPQPRFAAKISNLPEHAPGCRRSLSSAN